MTRLFPRERVEAILQPLKNRIPHRMQLKRLMGASMQVQAAPSRLCDGHIQSVLYAAGDTARNFVEVELPHVLDAHEVRLELWGSLIGHD
jgi:hypothetical protein